MFISYAYTSNLIINNSLSFMFSFDIVKEGLKEFYELNDNMPNSCKIPITRK